MDDEVLTEPVNGEHLEVDDETDAPMRRAPQTAPKPDRQSRTSKVFSEYIVHTLSEETS